MRMKELLKRAAITFMAATIVAAGSMAFGAKQVHASETVTKSKKVINGDETIYQDLVSYERAAVIEKIEEGGVVNKIDENTYEVTKGDHIYQYTVLDRMITINYYTQTYGTFENKFDGRRDAAIAIATYDIVEKEVKALRYIGGCYYFIVGSLPVSTITVKEVKAEEAEECSSLTIDANRNYMYAGDYATVTVTEMNGGSYTDLEWVCSDSRVTLIPDTDGQTCLVTAYEAVETVMVKAIAPNGVFAYVHISIM